MKKLVFVAGAVLLFVFVGLWADQVAFAGGGQVKRKDFALIGDVVETDVMAGTFEVAPESGFWGGGSVVTIYTTNQTTFAPSGVSLATLEPGDEVRTSGRIIDGNRFAEVVVLAP